jgi:hypothetical protein
MRDSIGGVFNLVIIVVFIVIVLGYLAFTVNYTKAFRMKNKIISLYEDYNGNCNSECEKKIKEYADLIGYKPSKITCDTANNYKDSGTSTKYCFKKVDVSNEANNSISDQKKRYYYKIVTKIDINIPIIENTLGIKVFSVKGNTKIFYN